MPVQSCNTMFLHASLVCFSGSDGRYDFDVTQIQQIQQICPLSVAAVLHTEVSEPAHRKMLDDLIIVNHWERTWNASERPKTHG